MALWHCPLRLGLETLPRRPAAGLGGHAHGFRPGWAAEASWEGGEGHRLALRSSGVRGRPLPWLRALGGVRSKGSTFLLGLGPRCGSCRAVQALPRS